MSLHHLCERARSVGALVSYVHGHVFVTALQLGVVCAFTDPGGLHDIIRRLSNQKDKLHSKQRSDSAGMHGRVVELMEIHEPLAEERKKLVYDPSRHMVVDRRDAYIYSQRMNAARRLMQKR